MNESAVNLTAIQGLTPEQQVAMAEMLGSLVAFAQGVFGHEPWAAQAEMMQSVMKYKAVAVKACHASSKTFAAAELTLWWLCRWRDSIVLTTSPTARQVESLLWGEIRKFLANRTDNNSFMPFPEPNVAKLTLSEGNYAMGFSTSPENAGVNFHGFHGRHLLIIVDEALGVVGPIWEAIDGVRAGGEVHVLVLCNPTSPTGPVYRMFTVDRAHWHTITIDAFDTPNLKGFTLDYLRQLPAGLSEDHPVFQYKPWPDLVNRWWVYDMYHKHGERSPVWQARVRGEFPLESENSLYPLDWLERAKMGSFVADRWPDMTARNIIVGIDVGGPGGDETAVAVRAGNDLIALKAWTQRDPFGAVRAFLEPYRQQIRVVLVDATGLGYHFVPRLSEAGFPVEEVWFGKEPKNRLGLALRRGAGGGS